MDRNDSTRALVNTALSSAIAVIIAVIGLFVPFMSIASFLWPVPVIIIIKRYGFRYGIYVTVVSGLIVGMISQPLYAAYVILGFGAIGLTIGLGVSKDYSAGVTLIVSSIASLMSKLLLIYMVTRIMGINPLDFQIEAIEKSFHLSSKFYKSIGLNNIENIEEMFTGYIQFFKIMIPALLISVSVVDSFINYIVSRTILKRLKLEMKPFPPFARWRFPRNIALGFIMMIALTYAGGYFGLDNTEVIMGNIFLLFNSVFLIQGLAVIYYYMTSKGWPKFGKIAVSVLILFNNILVLAVVFIGLIDGILDFRKLSAGK